MQRTPKPKNPGYETNSHMTRPIFLPEKPPAGELLDWEKEILPIEGLQGTQTIAVKMVSDFAAFMVISVGSVYAGRVRKHLWKDDPTGLAWF